MIYSLEDWDIAIFSLVFSLIMGISLLVTSSWMVSLYVKYCDYIKDYHYDYFDDFPPKCGHNENHFLILPLFGFITMLVWVRSYVATYACVAIYLRVIHAGVLVLYVARGFTRFLTAKSTCTVTRQTLIKVTRMCVSITCVHYYVTLLPPPVLLSSQD